MSARDRYVEKMKDQLDEWNRDLDGLEVRLKKVKAGIAEEAEARLSEARELYGTAKGKLDEIRSSDEPWESLKEDVEHVWKVMKQSVKYFRSQL